MRTSSVEDMRNNSLTQLSIELGCGAADITPPEGTFLMGTIHCKRSAVLFKDPLYAKAIIIQSNQRKVLIVSLDVTFIIEKYIHKIRNWAVERFGFDWESVMVHATQNHGAPAIGYTKFSDTFPFPEEFEWVRGQQASYHDYAMERIFEAIEQAASDIKLVQYGVASGIEGRASFNRRMVMRDGSIGMPRGILANSLYLEGPIDAEVGVMCFKNAQSEVVAAILNYTCHPVHELGVVGIVTADWPGQWSLQLADKLDSNCFSLVLNGACGNINPWGNYDPDYIEDSALMAKLLTTETEKVISLMDFTNKVTLDWAFKVLKIPIREPDPDKLAAAEALLAKRPAPFWEDTVNEIIDHEWVLAAQVVDVNNQRKRQAYYEYELQVLRIGNAVYVGLPGELFVEGGLKIKQHSKADFTYIVHATGNAGYIPFKEAFSRGGHELNYSNWSKLVPDAFEIIVEEAITLINKMFD